MNTKAFNFAPPKLPPECSSGRMPLKTAENKGTGKHIPMRKKSNDKEEIIFFPIKIIVALEDKHFPE